MVGLGREAKLAQSGLRQGSLDEMGGDLRTGQNALDERQMRWPRDWSSDVCSSDWHLGEVRLPVLGRLPGRALTGPAREVRQSTGAGAGGGQQRFEGGTGIGDHAVVGGEHASDLRGLDVDVDELASLPVDAEVTSMAIGPPVADADDEVGLEEGGRSEE